MTEPNERLLEEYRQKRVQDTARILLKVGGDPDPAIETLHHGAKQVAIKKKCGSLDPAQEDQGKRESNAGHVDPVAKMAAERHGGGSTPARATGGKETGKETDGSF